MVRRIAIPVLSACILLAAAIAPAQEFADYAPAPGYDPGGLVPTLFSFKRSGHPGRTQYGGSTAPAIPYQYATPQTAVPGVPYYGQDGYVTTREPIQPDWDEPTPLEATLHRVLHKSYYRFEYLLWDIQRPGSGDLLGAPLATVREPREPFPVFDFQNPPNEIGEAIVPDLGKISLRDKNGIRGTWGVETTFGGIEASVFALEKASDTFQVPGLTRQREVLNPITGILTIITPGRFAATSLLDNGRVSDIVELYNERFQVDYSTEIFGGEANLLFSDVVDFGFVRGLGLQFLAGFRYMRVEENMLQIGEFRDVTGSVPLLRSELESNASNDLFGPSFGCRLQYNHPWFTIGVDPKITLATDAYEAEVRTDQFRSANDPTVITRDSSNYFSPIGEVQAYARIKITENIRFTAGYSLLYLSRISRPYDNIYFNDNGPLPTPPGIVLKPESAEMRIDGFNAGFEIIFP